MFESEDFGKSMLISLALALYHLQVSADVNVHPPRVSKKSQILAKNTDVWPGGVTFNDGH